MARYRHGGGIADWTFTLGDEVIVGALTGKQAVVLGGQTITFWTAEQGGVQHTDLLDADGNPVTAIVSEDGTGVRSEGQIPPFYGPDGVRSMWAGVESGPRVLMVSSEDPKDEIGTILPPMSVPGAVAAPATGKGRLYNDTTVTLQVAAVRASVGTPPTTALVIDVNRNGATIFSTASNRPTIAVGSNTSGKVAPLDLALLAPGDYLTVDVDAGAGAADLVVQVLVTQAAS